MKHFSPNNSLDEVADILARQAVEKRSGMSKVAFSWEEIKNNWGRLGPQARWGLLGAGGGALLGAGTGYMTGDDERSVRRGAMMGALAGGLGGFGLGLANDSRQSFSSPQRQSPAEVASAAQQAKQREEEWLKQPARSQAEADAGRRAREGKYWGTRLIRTHGSWNPFNWSVLDKKERNLPSWLPPLPPGWHYEVTEPWNPFGSKSFQAVPDKAIPVPGVPVAGAGPAPLTKTQIQQQLNEEAYRRHRAKAMPPPVRKP